MVALIKKWTFCIFALFCCSLQATSAQILREAFSVCATLQPVSQETAQFWATAFAHFQDDIAVTAVAKILYTENFLTSHPDPAALEKIIHTFPPCDYLLNNTAWAHYQSGGDIQRAYQLIRRVKQYDRTTHDTYAMIALKLGYPAEALQRILPLLCDSRLHAEESYQEEDYIQAVVLFAHAGDIFYKNNLLVEAYRSWKEASTIASFLINNGYVSENLLLTCDYDHQRMQQKAAA
ncbi:MAG: hypothetical protein IJV69_07950, partial [Kiritimatiellae bacterium]|nr:hypothetical protein [Kiritimatiellia bacterium]